MSRTGTFELFRREIIPRHDDEPYLERLIVFRCPWFGIFLHRFVGGDDECTHDHPWSFVTLLLKGGYIEHVPTDDPPQFGREKSTWYGPGSLLFRPADWVHRVDIGKQKVVVSLVVHGRKERSWGFWTKLKGWIHHSKYSYHQHCE